MRQFSLVKSQLLYGSFKPKGIIFDQAKRVFNLKTPLSVQQIINQPQGDQQQQELPNILYTYSSVIQCATCLQVASCFSVQLCAKRSDIKKRQLKSFLQSYHYDQSGVSSQQYLNEIRFLLEQMEKKDADSMALLSLDRFFILPVSGLDQNGVLIEVLNQPLEKFSFDKLLCHSCKKTLGYLFHSKKLKTTSNMAFLNLEKILIQDQLCKEPLDPATNQKIKALPVKIDAAWYNVGLAHSSVAIASKQVQGQHEGYEREIRYAAEKIGSKVNDYNEQNIKGLQM